MPNRRRQQTQSRRMSRGQYLGAWYPSIWLEPHLAGLIPHGLLQNGFRSEYTLLGTWKLTQPASVPLSAGPDADQRRCCPGSSCSWLHLALGRILTCVFCRGWGCDPQHKSCVISHTKRRSSGQLDLNQLVRPPEFSYGTNPFVMDDYAITMPATKPPRLGVARPPAGLPCPLHADFGVMDQSGRAPVR